MASRKRFLDHHEIMDFLDNVPSGESDLESSVSSSEDSSGKFYSLLTIFSKQMGQILISYPIFDSACTQSPCNQSCFLLILQYFSYS